MFLWRNLSPTVLLDALAALVPRKSENDSGQAVKPAELSPLSRLADHRDRTKA
jgi:hypothetical protein